MKKREIIFPRVDEEEEKYEKSGETKIPNNIMEKIDMEDNLEDNFEQEFIIPKYIKKVHNNPQYPFKSNNIRKVGNNRNNSKNNHKYKTINMLPNNNLNIINPLHYNTHNFNNNNNINNVNNTNNTNNNNIYNKKRFSNNFTFSSIHSAKNSYISNQNNNLPNSNIKPIEYIQESYYTERQMKNNDDLKIIKNNLNIPPNIMVKKIYEIDDYFNKNLQKGLLNLKDIEVLKSNKISLIDISNEEIQKNVNNNKNISNTLGYFITKSNNKYKKNSSNKELKSLKHYEIKKSYDPFKNRKNSISKTITNGKERVFSEQPKRRRKSIYKRGKISNVIYYFTKKGSMSDILIARGMRNEKGGVVDFTTANTKKNYKINNYFLDNNITNKNIYKYPKWKIITSAKIIQKWWRNRVLLYNEFLNKIILIQNTFRNYKNRKYKEINKKSDLKKEENNNMNSKNNSKGNNELDNLKNRLKILSITLLKKIIQLNMNNNFNYFLLKMKDIIFNNQNNKILEYKYNTFIHSIIDYFNKRKNKNILLFLRKINSNKNFGNKNLEVRKLFSIYIRGPKVYKINNLIKKRNKLNYKYIKENIININLYPISKDKNKINNEIIKNNNEKQKNKVPKNSSKIILKEKDIIIFSKVKNDINEIAKIILKKIYLKIWYNKIIAIKNKEREKVYIRNRINGKTSHLLLRNIMIDIIEKIRKEANRRTLIKAFRNINKLKYPILFYSLLKIRKYSIVKFNVMNAYAKLIQKNYRYFRDKKMRINFYSISE